MRMKKRSIFSKVVFFGTAAGLYLYYFFQPSLDAEKILSQSIFKERTFQNKVQEVSSTDGKLSAYLMEEHSVPLVAVSFTFDKAGRAYETKEGTAVMAETVLLDGAGKYSRRELREIMKEKGIKLNVSAGNDKLSFSFSYVKQFEKEAFDILKAVLYNAHFDAPDMDLARRQLAALKKRQKEQPQYQLGQLVKKEFYGGHPYGKENIPETAVLNKVKAQDIRAYLKAGMAKDVFYAGIAGDITQQEATALLDDVFVKLSEKRTLGELPVFDGGYDKPAVEAQAPYSAQSYVMLVAPGVKRLDDDFYPLYLADYILGGAGLNSLLNQAVREEKGLTYGIYSGFSNSNAVDLWQIGYSATPENAKAAYETAAAVYRRFYDNGVTAEELEQAKKALLSSFNLRFSSLFNIAEMLQEMQSQKLGADFLVRRQGLVAAVSVEAVNEAIRRRMPVTLEKMRAFYLLGKNM